MFLPLHTQNFIDGLKKDNIVVEPRPKLSSVSLQSPFVVVLMQYPMVTSFTEDGFCPAEISYCLREQSRIVFKKNSRDFILQMVLDRERQLNFY